MRWSLFPLVLSVVCVATAYAAPIHYEESALYSRNPWRSTARILAKAVKNVVHPDKHPLPSTPITPAMLKASSATYRKAALQGSTFKVMGSRLTRIATPSKPPHGMQADHNLEAQTVAAGLKEGGYTKENLPAHALRQIKKIVNGPGNMHFIPAWLNNAKGAITRAALRGKPIDHLKHINYVKKYTGALHTEVKTAMDSVDKVLEKDGPNGHPKKVISKEQNKFLSAIKLWKKKV